MRATVVAAVVLVLAGCTGPAPAPGPLPEVRLGPMALETVPLEPWEARGRIAVTWDGALFAVHAVDEDGMPTYAVRDGDTLYTSQFGMGWTAWPVAEATTAEGRGFRYAAWDVDRLLDGAEVLEVSDGAFRVQAMHASAQGDVVAAVEVEHADGLVTLVRITTPADPESPFTLRPLATPFPFAATMPATWRTPADVAAHDATARDGHVRIVQWIQEHHQQLGRLPADATPDSLALQRLGAAWPTNPYDGTSMQDAERSGHFAWSVCSDQDGTFHGYGWDGAPLTQQFGTGC